VGRMARYLFFDVETTGLPKLRDAPESALDNWPRVVQIAWLEYDDEGNQLSKSNYIIKPRGFTIPSESTSVHGITNERAEKEGTEIDGVLRKFSRVIDQSDVLIAHNINFDQKVVAAEFLRANIPNGLSIIRKICTMKESTDFCQIPGLSGYKWPSLLELHSKLFRSGFTEAHDAEVDIAICAKCFFELLKKGIILV